MCICNTVIVVAIVMGSSPSARKGGSDIVQPNLQLHDIAKPETTIVSDFEHDSFLSLQPVLNRFDKIDWLINGCSAFKAFEEVKSKIVEGYSLILTDVVVVHHNNPLPSSLDIIVSNIVGSRDSEHIYDSLQPGVCNSHRLIYCMHHPTEVIKKFCLVKEKDLQPLQMKASCASRKCYRKHNINACFIRDNLDKFPEIDENDFKIQYSKKKGDCKILYYEISDELAGRAREYIEKEILSTIHATKLATAAVFVADSTSINQDLSIVLKENPQQPRPIVTICIRLKGILVKDDAGHENRISNCNESHKYNG